MRRLVELFETHRLDHDEIAAVLISVDGERDKPEVMKSFLASYSQDLVGLTGEPQVVKRLAAQFRAPFYKGNSAGMEAGGYTVAHSPQVYLLDAKGALRAEFYNASIEAMAGTAEALVEEQRAAGAIGNPGG
jgi:protein SCO1/2